MNDATPTLDATDDDDFARQHGFYLEDLAPGMSAVFAKTFTDADVLAFAGASGDVNPLHVNEEFAARTRFGTRIVHGMLTTSLWSTLVGTRLPGPGCAYMGQDIKFLRPVHVGETVTARMTVATIDAARQRVELDAECRVGGELVAVGRGRVWVPRRPA
jgi:3-hydroxybutyryl-CoA dehydratase